VLPQNVFTVAFTDTRMAPPSSITNGWTSSIFADAVQSLATAAVATDNSKIEAPILSRALSLWLHNISRVTELHRGHRGPSSGIASI